MPLSAGTRLGAYEILAPIGAGGMGEVYRARDTKLKRDVALKVLPEAFANEPARMLRFQREAELLASLNHPNIAHIYGVEDRALVMELVEGRTLPSPLPIETALDYARQIADALEYAHEKGVIHRDLKPANIKVTPEGVVKLLDFGLAKAIEDPTAATDDPSQSPTLTLGATRVGMIMGTAAYMSPEQAAGKPVDRRSDIWSFGAVLYEMLSGKKAFDGESVSDTLASVLKLEPDWSALPAGTPDSIRKVVRRCLTKDRKQRLQAIGEARIVLENAGVEEPAPRTASKGSARRARLGLIAAAVLAAAAAGSGWLAWRATRGVGRPLVRLDVDLGPDISLPAPDNTGPSVIISPDGNRIAYVASVQGGRTKLFTRRLDQPAPVELPGTDSAVAPFISPDGQWIGFSIPPNKLNKISVEGGAVVPISTVALSPGASWGEDGTIVGGYIGGGLARIAPGGGPPEPLTQLINGEVAHTFPQILPGGKAVLFVANVLNTAVTFGGNIEVLTLANRGRKLLVRGATAPHYLPTGHLVYLSGSTLFAVPFDLDKLEVHGTAIPILDDVEHEQRQNRAGQFAISASGTLIYRKSKSSGANTAVTLQWLDSSGKRKPLPAQPGSYFTPRFSPDGTRVAVTGVGASDYNIQIYDLDRDTWVHITAGLEGFANPIWSPDGQYMVFASTRGGLFWTRWDRPGQVQPLTQSKSTQLPYSFSRDGKRLVGIERGAGMRIFTIPVEWEGGQLRTGKPEPFGENQAIEPSFSPDGRWLAYKSLEAAKQEVYVSAFPTGGTWQISEGGGRNPVWSQSAPELFYESPDGQIMTVRYTAKGDSFVPEKPRVWAEKVAGQWDLAPDGRRLLVMTQVAAPEVPKADHELVFLENFFDYLGKKVPVNR